MAEAAKEESGGVAYPADSCKGANPSAPPADSNGPTPGAPAPKTEMPGNAGGT